MCVCVCGGGGGGNGGAVVRICLPMQETQETQVWSLSQEDPPLE